MLQRAHVIDEVTDGAAESIEPPDHESAAGADLVQELIELGTGFTCAGGRAGEDAVASCFGQCIVLELCVLVAGRDSGLSEEVSYGSKCIDTYGMALVSTHSLWH